MSQSYSAIQQQYPLSPRKFWKKIISKTFAWAIVMIIFPGLIGLIIGLAGQDASPNIIRPIFIGVLIGLVVYCVLIFFPYAIYVNIYIKRYYYDLNENFITIKKGVFAPTEIHVQFQKIQDVYVDQDFLDRLMGLYDVHIASATATSGMEAHIDGVDHDAAEGLKNILLGKISTGNTSSQQASSVQNRDAKINLGQKISSLEFPVDKRWLISMIFKSASTVILLLLGLSIGAISRDLPSGGDTSLYSSQFIFYLVLLLLFALGNIIYWSIWLKNYYFAYEPDYILERTQVFSKSEKHVPYRSIQNVTIMQGIIERLFGICTVIIENAAQGGSSKLTIPGQTKERGQELLNLTNSITSQINNTQVTGL